MILNGYITTGVILFGTIGNLNGVKSVHVTSLDKNRGVVLAVSMLALAFWDTVLLWSAFFYYGAKKLNVLNNLYLDRLNTIIPYFHALSHVANTASVGLHYISIEDKFRTKIKNSQDVGRDYYFHYIFFIIFFYNNFIIILLYFFRKKNFDRSC